MPRPPHQRPTTQPPALVNIDSLLGSRAGATTLEFALVALGYFTLVFGIVEFSRVVWTKSAMHYAVEAAARCAVVNATRCGTEANVQTYALGQMFASGATASSFEIAACSGGTGKKVTATVQFSFMVGMDMPGSLTLRAESCRPA